MDPLGTEQLQKPEPSAGVVGRPHDLRLTDDVRKVSEELDKMNGEILQLIDDESNKAHVLSLWLQEYILLIPTLWPKV